MDPIYKQNNTLKMNELETIPIYENIFGHANVSNNKNIPPRWKVVCAGLFFLI